MAFFHFLRVVCSTVKPVLSGPHVKRTPAWVLKFPSHIHCKSNLYSVDPSIKRTQTPKYKKTVLSGHFK